jgi:glycosyltransferase involved in cell wall biosynthesis
LRLRRGAGPAAETIDARAVWQAAGVAWKLRGALARRRRVFHGHSRAGLLVGLWLRLLGSERVVVSVHCHGKRKWFYRWAALVLGGRLVWLTPAMKAHYDAGGKNWRGCQRNFLAASASAPRARAPRSDRLRLGGIGALVPWKGWSLVLAALARLPPAARARVEFSHLGSADDTAESRRHAEALRALAAELGVAERVRWRGEEPSSAALLAEVDVVVVPSDHEPFSMALLEAGRAGVPVLAADGGGPAELIAVGRDGWLFAAGSADALAEKITELLRGTALAAARPESPDAAPVIARWREIYAEVLA